MVEEVHVAVQGEGAGPDHVGPKVLGGSSAGPIAFLGQKDGVGGLLREPVLVKTDLGKKVLHLGEPPGPPLLIDDGVHGPDKSAEGELPLPPVVGFEQPPLRMVRGYEAHAPPLLRATVAERGRVGLEVEGPIGFELGLGPRHCQLLDHDLVLAVLILPLALAGQHVLSRHNLLSDVDSAAQDDLFRFFLGLLQEEVEEGGFYVARNLGSFQGMNSSS